MPIIPSQEMCSLTKLIENEGIKRAGIIPYIKKNNTVVVLLTLEPGIAGISDLGGSREAKDENIFQTGIREFNEESFGVLGTLNEKHLTSSPYIVAKTGYHGEEGVLFFVKFRSEFPFIRMMDEFKERNVPGDETKALIVLTKEQLFTALEKPDERILSSKLFLFHPKVKSILLSGRETISSL